MNLSTLRSQRVRKGIRLGLLALLVLLALGPLANLWRVNHVGLLLNRYVATGQDHWLHQAEDLENYLPVDPPRPGMWSVSALRTYGFMAAQDPTQWRYTTLLSAHSQGLLDRDGELWLAEVAAATGHWSQADESYRRVDASNLLITRGETALANNQLGLARNWYLAALASLTATEERGASTYATTIGLTRVASGFMQLGDPQRAADIYRHALAQSRVTSPGVRERAEIYFGLAKALARLEPVDDAEAKNRQGTIASMVSLGLATYPGAWSETQAGQVYLLTHERARAIRHFERALALDPRASEAYLALGHVLEDDGLPSLARDLYEVGVRECPGDATLLDAYAFAAYQTMAPAAALPILQDAARSGGRDPYVFAYLGDTLFELGRVAEAAAAYRQGLRLFAEAEPLLTRVRDMQRWKGARAE